MLQDGDTALHLAACKNRVEVVKLLVKHGATLDVRDKVIKLMLTK